MKKENKKTNKVDSLEMVESSKYILSVKSPFRNFQRGDLIKDAEEIKKVLECNEKMMVNKVIKK